MGSIMHAVHLQGENMYEVRCLDLPPRFRRSREVGRSVAMEVFVSPCFGMPDYIVEGRGPEIRSRRSCRMRAASVSHTLRSRYYAETGAPDCI